ncbi:MAG: (Fe-S)-binding protein [Wolinella sp.]
MFDYQKVSNACVKCGKCIPVCTIYKIHPDETTSPRGFIDLLGAYERGDLELDKNTKRIFETCFLCTSCTYVCPNKLPTDQIIENVRRDIADKFGIAWFKRAYFFLLRNRNIMNWAFKLGSYFTPLLFKNLPEKQSMRPRFSLPFIGDRVFMWLRPKNFIDSYPEITKNAPAERARRVAIFIGCLANYNYTKIGDSLMTILHELEIDAFIPKKQQCCAAPAYFTGDFATVEKLIKQNVEYFETFFDDIEAMIIPEATCSAMILEDWSRFMDKDPEWKERIERLLPKIFIASDWLYNKTDLLARLKALSVQLDSTITYHDPCHSRKVLGVFNEPRALISANYKLVEMSDPNQCCGFGGVTMQTERFSLSREVGISKAKMIEKTGARIVSAECSACRMQLTNALAHENVDVEFAHPLELIADAIKMARG